MTSEVDLRTLRREVKEDLRVFRHMQSLLTRRLSEVNVRRSADGLILSQLPEFAGTEAVRATLSLSLIQMEYMLAALDTQLGHTDSEVVQLFGGDRDR